MLIHGAVDNDIFPPRFGSTQRSFGLYRGLARRHDVRVLCVVPNRNAAPRDERAEGVALMRRKAWYTSVAWRLERARLAPMAAAAWGHALDARRLRGALAGRPDVFAADFNLTPLLAGSRARLRVYLAQNVEADYFASAGPPVRASRWWAGRLRAHEARAADTAHVVVAVSEEDAERFALLYGVERARLAVIPNGWDDRSLTPATPPARGAARTALGLPADAYAALFVGSDVPHNRAALAWLLERVWPAAERAGIVMLVAGSVCGALSAPASPRLRLLGEVGALAPLLHAADAGLNPALVGGGSNVKLPTYLAAGLAVVSTPFGVRGYASLAPWVTLAEPAAFAEAMAARPAGWAARGQAMPAAVADHAWSRLGERLGDVWTERLGLAPQTAPAAAPAPAPGGGPPDAAAARRAIA